MGDSLWLLLVVDLHRRVDARMACKIDRGQRIRLLVKRQSILARQPRTYDALLWQDFVIVLIRDLYLATVIALALLGKSL